ncbi:MAG: hypothetical protein HYR63_10190 [Proteobacteria bacterium]|nr:hypothetical protein [Pseudomonadota bacterium]MBI3499763.1 hypothetical protein [Pseudomonadota bacterium]
MARNGLRYDQMMDEALRGVVRSALVEAAEDGLPGEHHFYVSFRTDWPGVEIPDYLRTKYPQEMTIVLQFQFWGLEVGEDIFAVSLSFNNARERLVIPLAAVTVFADPAAKFTLQFQGQQRGQAAQSGKLAPIEAMAEGPGDGEASKVVALDAFRKK